MIPNRPKPLHILLQEMNQTVLETKQELIATRQEVAELKAQLMPVQEGEVITE
jgi:hypothetical protein